jgi:hypothetical protein
MNNAAFIADQSYRSIKRAVVKRAVRIAVLKDSKAYEKLHKQLTQAMTKAWTDQMRKGVADALNRLQDLGPGKFTSADAKSILAVFENAVGGEAIAAAFREPVINLSDGLVRAGAIEVSAAAAIDIAFNRADLDALDLIKRGNIFPVTNSWDAVTRDRINPILIDYFNKSMTRAQLTSRFADDFAEMTNKSRAYWELLADHIATKTREMGRVTGYERAGVQYVQVRAQLDDRTTKICRDMHGRVISVAKLSAQRASYLDAVARDDTTSAKEAWTMHAAATDYSRAATTALPPATASPPYHFRCRTITVIYFPPTDDVGKWQQKIADREAFSKAETQKIGERAASASFLKEKQARAKFQRHRANIPAKKLADYEADARALIADKNAKMILSSRTPKANAKSQERTPHAVYFKPQKNRKTGDDGFLVTVVELDENVIVSHHWRDNAGSENDAIPGVVQKKKGLLQWLFG